ncbi:hypothetical protein GCM10010467_30260 [Actinocorallia glomerata]|uniref:Uncharacterized protein n=1 Tax=Actinocorallia glomerata TaxID=46203 RepID=A0ABP6PUX8_9ACTN
MKLTGTNKPTTYTTHTFLTFVGVGMGVQQESLEKLRVRVH